MPNAGSNFQYYLYDMLSEIRSRMQRTKLFSVYAVETDLTTINPSSEWEYLNASGSGRLCYAVHYSKGIAPEKAGHYANLDDGGWTGGFYWISVDGAQSHGFNSAGTVYNLGQQALLVRIWDTANNEYYVLNFSLWSEFADSFKAKLVNLDDTNSSNQKAITILSMYVASRRIKFHSKRYWGEAVYEIKEMINRRFGLCSAVISDISIDEDFNLVNKREAINRLTIFIDDRTYKKFKDKIINRLIKENLVYDIIERPKSSVKIRR